MDCAVQNNAYSGMCSRDSFHAHRSCTGRHCLTRVARGVGMSACFVRILFSEMAPSKWGLLGEAKVIAGH